MAELLSWQHQNPVKVVAGALASVHEHVPAGSHVLLVTSAGATHRGVVASAVAALPGRRVTVFDAVQPNPDIAAIDAATLRYRSQGVDLVLALGGGSAMDAGKALALSLRCGLDNPLALAFQQGQAVAWTSRLPLLAVPTTAGTGAEVTPFATIWDHQAHRKHSLGQHLVYPDLALLDASLTLSLSERDTLFPGLDAVSHALESLWNRHRTPVSRALALEALAISVDALPAAIAQPGALQHRAAMQAASLMAGLAISQTRTALAHAISYPVTTHFGVPHGLACSFTLPAMLRSNLASLPVHAGERLLLQRTLDMLQGFDLPARVRSYTTLDAMCALHAQMLQPGRADNYEGQPLGSVVDILTVAMQGPD